MKITVPVCAQYGVNIGICFQSFAERMEAIAFLSVIPMPVALGLGAGVAPLRAEFAAAGVLCTLEDQTEEPCSNGCETGCCEEGVQQDAAWLGASGVAAVLLALLFAPRLRACSNAAWATLQLAETCCCTWRL